VNLGEPFEVVAVLETLGDRLAAIPLQALWDGLPNPVPAKRAS